MPHLSSFFVGTLTAGSGFLLIHRELSHRSRLSSRWALAEKTEAQMRSLMDTIKQSTGVDNNAKESKKDTKSLKQSSSTDYWNSGVESSRKLVKDVMFGDKSNRES